MGLRRTIYAHWPWLAALFLVGIAAFLLASPAQAVIFTREGIIAAGEVVNDDIFISTSDVTIDGVVNGDVFINSYRSVVNGDVNGNLIVNGSELILNGKVNGSLVFTGQTAHLHGQVDGTVYAAGSTLFLYETARVARNLFYLGFGLESKPGSQVGMDLLANTYQIVIQGQVARNVYGDASALEISGNIGGDVIVKVAEPGAAPDFMLEMPFLQGSSQPERLLNPGLLILDGAQIGGALTYLSPVEQGQTILSQPAGGVIYQPPAPEAETTEPPPWSDLLHNLATLLILGCLAVWLAPRVLQQVGEQGRQKPWKSALWGLLTLISGLIAPPLLLATVLIVSILIGAIHLDGLSILVLWVGVMMLIVTITVFVLLVGFGAKVICVYLAARLVFARFAAQWLENRFLVMVVGIVVYVLLAAIPCLGWTLGAAATLVGLGALGLFLRDKATPAEPDPALDLSGAHV